jgi:hypothetical protein
MPGFNNTTIRGDVASHNKKAGGETMKKQIVLLLALLLGLSTTVSAEFPSSTALAKAESFVVILDNRNYGEAYLQSSDLLKLRTPQKEWIEQQKTAFHLLGDVQKRQLMAVKARDIYPGLPDGNYLIVCFETRTAHKARAIEVVLLREEETDWRVCNYSIR